MAVPTLITDLSPAASSNSPAGSDSIGTSLDDFIRAHASFIAKLYAEKLQSSSYTAADVLTKLLTVDGSGSGLDADKLDGIEGAAVMKKSADSDLDMNDYKISEIKTATFKQQGTLSTTTGAVTVDWSVAQNYKQNEPTGSITYTFTAPPGPCHLQLVIDSDGTSTAQTITWPGTVVWFGATWAGTNNKKAVINFWYNGTNYFAMGANQV